MIAYDINAGGQIAGLALQVSTGQLHGFLATPHDDAGGAEPAAQVSGKVEIPDNMRAVLQQLHRIGAAGPR